MEELLAERERRRKNLHNRMFPDTGSLRRELYPRHLEFFAAGTQYRERCFMAGNRVGKTVAGGYELVCHLTGNYPHWWAGRRFDKPVVATAAGDTAKTTRDIIQGKLLGPVHDLGTGLVPGGAIVDKRPKTGVPDAFEVVYVQHVAGGVSTLFLKSYDQRRQAFQGDEMDYVWLDEEPPLDIYTECLLRTMTTDGLVVLTFTPLMGMSDVVMSFLEDGRLPGRVDLDPGVRAHGDPA
jgi:phage terminase large subunit-like protein